MRLEIYHDGQLVNEFNGARECLASFISNISDKSIKHIYGMSPKHNEIKITIDLSYTNWNYEKCNYIYVYYVPYNAGMVDSYSILREFEEEILCQHTS